MALPELLLNDPGLLESYQQGALLGGGPRPVPNPSPGGLSQLGQVVGHLGGLAGGHYLGSSVLGALGGGGAGAGASAAGATGSGASALAGLAGLGPIGAALATSAFFAPTVDKNITGNPGKLLSGKADEDTKVKAVLLTNPITAPIAAGLDFLGVDLFGHHSPDHIRRNQVRHALKENTDLIDENGRFTLADGTKVREGELDTDLLPEGKSFNVDFSRDGIGDIVGSLNPLAEIIQRRTDMPDHIRENFAGILSNIASSEGDVTENVKNFYDQAGLSRDDAFTNILQASDPNIAGDAALDAGTRDAMLAAIDKVFGVENPNQGKGKDSAGFTDTGN